MGVGSLLRNEFRVLWEGKNGLSLGVISLSWGLLVGSRVIFPVIIPHLRTDYNLSLSLAGVLITCLWVSFAVGQLPAGVLADRFNERSVMMGSIFLTVVGIGFVLTASSLLSLFLATATWGFGSSLFGIARITFLSKLFPDYLGSALGITMATADITQTIFPPIASALAVAIAWEAGLGFLTPFLLLTGFLFLVVPHDTTASGEGGSAFTRDTITDAVAELRNPYIGYMMVLMFLYYFIWHGFTSFYPTYLLTVKGLSQTRTGLLFGLFFATGVLLKPVAGWMYDTVGMRATALSTLIPPIFGFLILPMTDSFWILTVGTLLISAMLGIGPVLQTYVAQFLSDDLQGTGLGLVQTPTIILAAGGPAIFGLLADNGFFDLGYIFLAGLMVVTTVLSIKVK